MDLFSAGGDSHNPPRGDIPGKETCFREGKVTVDTRAVRGPTDLSNALSAGCRQLTKTKRNKRKTYYVKQS